MITASEMTAYELWRRGTKATPDNSVGFVIPAQAPHPDPTGNSIWLAHTQSSTYGTRVKVLPFSVGCNGGVITPTTGTTLQPQDPCYRFNGAGSPLCYGADGGIVGGNGPDGGIVVNDEWGPAIAYLYNATTSSGELVVTWYDTRDDTNNRNVRIQGASGINGANPFSTMFHVAAGTGVPWDHTLASWWDYQAIGIDLTHYTFLAAWGGDSRNGGSEAGIWSSRIQ